MHQQVAIQWSKLEHAVVCYTNLCSDNFTLLSGYCSARNKLRKLVSGLWQLLYFSQLGEELGSTYSLTLSLTHPPTLSISLTHTLTHSHTHSLTLSLSLLYTEQGNSTTHYNSKQEKIRQRKAQLLP